MFIFRLSKCLLKLGVGLLDARELIRNNKINVFAKKIIKLIVMHK